MNAEPRLFDGLEEEARENEKQEFLSKFKYLDRDFVAEVTGKFHPSFRPLKYSEAFQKFTSDLEQIREELEKDDIDIYVAFKRASGAEAQNGFGPSLSLNADKRIDASGHINLLAAEIDKLKFYPDYPSHADNGELSSARSTLSYLEEREIKKAQAYLTLKPFVTYTVDENKLRGEIHSGLVDAFYHILTEDDRNAIVGWRGAVDFNDIVNQTVEAVRQPLAERGVIIKQPEPKPKQA